MGSTQVLWISAEPELPADWPHHPAVWNIEIQPAEEAIEALAVADYAAIVLDLPLPGWTAATLLEAVQRAAPGVPVLVRDPKRFGRRGRPVGASGDLPVPAGG